MRGADAAMTDGDCSMSARPGPTRPHTVTQADIDNNGGGDGDIDNIATADSNETGPDTRDATVPMTQAPALNIVKASEVTDGDGEARPTARAT